jgi:hypothetical protein
MLESFALIKKLQ